MNRGETKVMEVRKLRYFISVAEHLNFTNAAKELFVAQPAVSQQIAALEKEIGIKLFYRDKQSVRLTNAGTSFLKDAKEIIQKIEDAIDNAVQANEGLIGHLRIGLLSAPVRYFLPVLVRYFSKKYPKIKLDMNFYHTGQIIEKLNSNEIDIAFTIDLGVPTVSDIEYRRLWTQHHCVIMNEEHPLASRSSIDISEIAQEKFVMLDRSEAPSGYDLMLSMCANHGFTPNIVNHADRVDTVLLMVDAGIGITILVNHLKAFATPSLRFINIENNNYPVDVVALWKKNNTNPTTTLFVNEMESLLEMPNNFFSFI